MLAAVTVVSMHSPELEASPARRSAMQFSFRMSLCERMCDRKTASKERIKSMTRSIALDRVGPFLSGPLA